ncbi:dnaJ homolog subfamily C member 24 isoform X2 [Tursiops truncatus]|uniref:dnaJ homolog subfamily C member 24 isoform X2 n=1 Tax=Tursiops truncatus TaxID=9739 RepID=UPI003CCF661C
MKTNYHPDKQSADVPAGTVEECIQKFIEVDQAWKILGNEETKKEYDLQRHVLEAEKSKIEVQVDEDPGQVAFWLAKDHFLAVSSYDTFLQDDLRNMGPVDARVYLEEMSWNEDDHSFSLSCRCGGKYSVSKDEAEEVTLISCDMCSLVIELLHYR